MTMQEQDAFRDYLRNIEDELLEAVTTDYIWLASQTEGAAGVAVSLETRRLPRRMFAPRQAANLAPGGTGPCRSHGPGGLRNSGTGLLACLLRPAYRKDRPGGLSHFTYGDWTPSDFRL